MFNITKHGRGPQSRPNSFSAFITICPIILGSRKTCSYRNLAGHTRWGCVPAPGKRTVGSGRCRACAQPSAPSGGAWRPRCAPLEGRPLPGQAGRQHGGRGSLRTQPSVMQQRSSTYYCTFSTARAVEDLAKKINLFFYSQTVVIRVPGPGS